MDADLHRFYPGMEDLATVIWHDQITPSKLLSRINGLPDDSAFVRELADGHTTLHELLAQVRDAVVTTAHGWRLEGKPEPYPRPGRVERSRDRVFDPTNPEDAAEIRRFFGR